MNNKIGFCICQHRQIKNMTQEEFALRLGVTPQAVSKWETGKGYPDLSLVSGICSILGIGADTLLGIEKTVVENGNIKADIEIKNNLIAVPLVLEFGKNFISAVGEGLKTDLVNKKRLDLAHRKGFLLPVIRIRDNLELKDNAFRVLIYGKTIAEKVIAIDEQDVYGCMISTLSQICEEHYSEIINKHIVKILVDNVKEQYPGIADGIVPEKISYIKILHCLKDRINKNQDIKDLIHILETLEEEAE